MPNKKTGREVPCVVCGTLIYRSANYLARGYKRITCLSDECKSKSVMGERNPFWGRDHSAETLARISESKRARPPQRKGGPPKGYKHTPEARAKITAALKARWVANRDKMIAALTRPPKPKELLRYRRNFTPLQRKTWKEPSCRWCGATEKLVLDHVIPVMCGGNGERRNAQTLCQPCNIWKMAHVDRQLFLAGLGQ